MLFKNPILFPLEPSETFRFGDGTRAALVDMPCARAGSRQNGVARWTASRVVRVAPQRRSFAQDAPATAHNRRHYHETAANHRRYYNMHHRVCNVFRVVLGLYLLKVWECGNDSLKLLYTGTWVVTITYLVTVTNKIIMLIVRRNVW